MTIEPALGSLSLADRVKSETWALHREAERSGIMQGLLRDRAAQADYALLLANLLPVYEALEDALGRLPADSPLRCFARPEIYRSTALRADLAGLGVRAGTPLPSARRYAARIAEVAETKYGLVAHAYVRYLGDLNGGQILKRLLGKHLGLGPHQLGFYAFPAVADPPAFAADYRAGIDRLNLAPDTADALVAEAQRAFRLNIDLSAEVQHAVERRSTSS